MKRWIVLSLMLGCNVSMADPTTDSPTNSANPPQSMSQDDNVPTKPNIYGPQQPLSKQPPKGTIVVPAEPPSPPAPVPGDTGLIPNQPS